jgi:hypothetical protein
VAPSQEGLSSMSEYMYTQGECCHVPILLIRKIVNGMHVRCMYVCVEVD